MWPWRLALVVGLWLYVHSYSGLADDARLYTMQALRVLQPDAFQGELIFSTSSQDAFTLFPRLHAVFVAALGAAAAGLWLTLFGQALWLGGAIFLFRRCASGGRLFWGLLGLVALSPDVGGVSVFQYGEGFLTARLYAEALTLWALAVAPERRLWAVLLAVVAALLHPIYGVIALGAAVLLLAGRDMRWAALIPVGAGAAIALGAADIGPFAALFAEMDGRWRSVAEGRNAVCFPLGWRAEDWAQIVVDALVVGLALLSASSRFRDLLLAGLVAGLGGLALSVYGDATNNLLLIQLQLSRGLWLVAALANFALGAVAHDLWRREGGRAVFALLATGFLMPLFPVFAFATVATASWLAWRLLRSEASAPPAWAQAGGYVVLIGAGLIYLASRGAALAGDALQAAEAGRDWLLALLRSPVGLDRLIVLLPLCLWPRRLSLGGRGVPVAALAVLVMGAVAWNARGRFARDLEHGRGFETMRQAIPASAQVFWHARGPMADKEAELIWFGLARTPYLSYTQGAGLIFDRDLALEYERRAGALGELLPLEYLAEPLEAGKAMRAMPEPSLNDVRTACEQARGLGYIVVDVPVAPNPITVFEPSAPAVSVGFLREEPERTKRPGSYYLYDCSKLRDEMR